jgi:hypothetical protein
MKKVKIDNFNLGDKVQVTSYNPPAIGKVVDMYELDPMMVSEDELKRKYPKGVPVFEVILEESGRLRSFVKDVVKKV